MQLTEKARLNTVTSGDGTEIACWTGGRGPHLVLVHGTSASHTRWTAIRPRFEEHFTVTAIDRRGRGQSGDAPHYDIEREFEDVAAVVETLDSPVLLFGHSYGAICALEAAFRTDKLAGLILYEPPIANESIYAPGQLDRLATLLAAGDRDGMVAAFFTEVVGLPPQHLEIARASPAWPDRVAAAHPAVYLNRKTGEIGSYTQLSIKPAHFRSRPSYAFSAPFAGTSADRR